MDIEDKKIGQSSVIDSFNNAIEGIIEAVKTERHMKFHIYITIVVILLSLFLNLEKMDIALLSIAVAIVWVAELINTALEAIVDLYVGDEYHDLAKIAKDTSAGAVFVAAVNSLIIAYLVLYNHFEKGAESVIVRIKNSNVHTAFFSIILVVVIVVIIKAYNRSGTPFRGGAVSGHSAMAFSLWVSVLFSAESIVVAILTFLMALLVAQTRVKAKIHTVHEVSFGAIIGGGITYLIFILLEKL